MINWLGRYIASVGINGLKEKEKDVGNIIWRGLASGIREGVHNNILAPLGLDRVASVLSGGVSSIQSYMGKSPEAKQFLKITMIGLGAYFLTKKIQDIVKPPESKTIIEKMMGNITNAILPSFSSRFMLPLVAIVGGVILKNNFLPQDILQKVQDYGLGSIMGGASEGGENSFSDHLHDMILPFISEQNIPTDSEKDHNKENIFPRDDLRETMMKRRLSHLFADPVAKIQGRE